MGRWRKRGRKGESRQIKKTIKMRFSVDVEEERKSENKDKTRSRR